MNFENLKGLMGDSYHDGITAEEVNSFFAGKSFADLSTGQYVDKNKYDRDIQNLNNTITEKTNALNSKLTDDEKASAEREQDKKEIARLTDLLKQNTISSNKNLAKSETNNIKSILTLKEDDTDYDTFINNIVSDSSEKTIAIAKYVSKIINESYEKGKQDALKDSMGKFGNSKKQSSEKSSDDVENIGAKLAKKSMNKKETINYFERK